MMCSNLFVRPKPISNPKVRLYCFPFAGGGSNTFFSWINKFCDEVELVLIQPPGRGTRMLEVPHDDMDSLINELMQYADFITQTPYLFFGHSLGCRVAYELCCRFKSTRKPLPAYFIASASRAPHLKSEQEPSHDLPDGDFIKTLERLNGTPKEVLGNEELMSLLLPLIRADFKIAETYFANQIKMPFPMLICHGKNDSTVNAKKLDAWGDLTSEGHRLVEFEGGHFFINENSEQITSCISNLLNEIKV